MTADAFPLPSCPQHRLALIPDKTRRCLRLKEKIFTSIAAEVQRTGNPRIVMERCRDMAAQIAMRGFSTNTLYQQYYRWLKKGRDTAALSDYGKSAKIGLPEPFLEFWRGLCEQNQRKCKPAWRRLVFDLWRAGQAIPAYGTWRDWFRREFPDRDIPKVCPPDLPYGWTYENLMRHRPTKLELAVTRIGREAAAPFRPLVYTSRVGLYVGSHYFFDDMWHDHFVNSLVHRKAGRPLEFHGLDGYSGMKFCFGLTVRLQREDGTNSGLNERMMRMLLAKALAVDGYSPRGTTLCVEHGTAAIRDDVAEELSYLTGGLVKVERSGMTGASAHAAQYAGRAKGNFRFKAALESLGNLIHNEMGALPGQTGKDTDHRPDELHGLLRHNDALLAALGQLDPETAALVRLPLLEFSEFHRVAEAIYDRINRRTEHDLEGWEDCGHVTTEWRPATALPWLPRETLAALPPDQQAGVLALIEGTPGLIRTRRLSPFEVWERGRRELLRLPGYGVCAILGDDLAAERTVRGARFEFQDAEVGPGVHRFEAVADDGAGQLVRLREGESFQTFVNPFAPDRLFVRDARGGYVGECARITAPSRADLDAVTRAMGRAAKEETALLTPLRLRHLAEARQRTADARHNAALLTGPRVPAVATQRTAMDALTDDDRAAATERRDDAEDPTFTSEEISGFFATEPDTQTDTADLTDLQ